MNTAIENDLRQALLDALARLAGWNLEDLTFIFDQTSLVSSFVPNLVFNNQVEIDRWSNDVVVPLNTAVLAWMGHFGSEAYVYINNVWAVMFSAELHPTGEFLTITLKFKVV